MQSSSQSPPRIALPFHLPSYRCVVRCESTARRVLALPSHRYSTLLLSIPFRCQSQRVLSLSILIPATRFLSLSPLRISLPSLFVTHADQSPYPLHRHPRNRHPFLLSPRLAFHPPMRKGAAPKRDPFRAGISLQFVTHPSLIRSGLLQAWPRTSWRHHSFPPHRRSYPRCRIGGIRLRQASRAAPRGAASRCSRRRTARFGCRGR